MKHFIIMILGAVLMPCAAWGAYVNYTSGARLGDRPLPTLPAGEAAEFQMAMINIGLEDIHSIGYTVQINDDEPIEMTAEIELPSGANQWVYFPSPVLPEGHNTVTVTITRLNETERNDVSTTEYIGADPSMMVDRMMVVEEFSGVWCPYCPEGVYALEYMRANYPDRFIGISVHYQDYYEIKGYEELNQSPYNIGLPSCLINRDVNMRIIAAAESLESTLVNEMWDSKSGIKMNVTAQEWQNQIYVDVVSTFGFSNNNSRYAIAVVITEDDKWGVQTNGYYGWEEYGPGEWGYMEKYPQYWFEDIAMYISSCWGDENSVPEVIAKGMPMVYRAVAPREEIEDFDKCHAVALMLDTETKAVLNGARCDVTRATAEPEMPDPGSQSAISNVEVSWTEAVQWYNLQGQRVANPAGGVYIRATVDGVEKVVLP